MSEKPSHFSLFGSPWHPSRFEEGIVNNIRLGHGLVEPAPTVVCRQRRPDSRLPLLILKVSVRVFSALGAPLNFLFLKELVLRAGGIKNIDGKLLNRSNKKLDRYGTVPTYSTGTALYLPIICAK